MRRSGELSNVRSKFEDLSYFWCYNIAKSDFLFKGTIDLMGGSQLKDTCKIEYNLPHLQVAQLVIGLRVRDLGNTWTVTV